MPRWWCTFQQKDSLRKKAYTIIDAASIEQAHDVMRALYDDNWSRVYDSAVAAGVERHDLNYIEPGY